MPQRHRGHREELFFDKNTHPQENETADRRRWTQDARLILWERLSSLDDHGQKPVPTNAINATNAIDAIDAIDAMNQTPNNDTDFH